MNLNPFITLFVQVIGLYKFSVLLYLVMHWLIYFNFIKKNNSTIKSIFYSLHKITEPILEKIRKYIPSIGVIDISPIVLFLLLTFLQNILLSYFYVK